MSEQRGHVPKPNRPTPATQVPDRRNAASRAGRYADMRPTERGYKTTAQLMQEDEKLEADLRGARSRGKSVQIPMDRLIRQRGQRRSQAEIQQQKKKQSNKKSKSVDPDTLDDYHWNN